MDDEVVTIETVSGMLEAEILRGLLESAGIRVWLSHEAAGTAVGLGVGPLAEVDINVQQQDENLARHIVEEYRSGKLAGAEG
ncbi:MAG: DUF2007 domain-containing protein [Chloroflexota bacterium]